MESSIRTAEDIANALAAFDLDQASSHLSRSELPGDLYHALNKILLNLTSYKPYLPEAILSPSGSNLPTTECVPGLSTGCAAIVFTDILSSTATWNAMPHAMKSGLRTHNMALRAVLRTCNGYEVKTIGDSFMVAFQTLDDALGFALGSQVGLYQEHWPEELSELPQCSVEKGAWNGLRIRIGVHYGEIEVEKNCLSDRDVVTCTAVAFRYTADEVFSLAVFEDSQGVHFDGIDGSSVPSTAAQEDGYTFIFDYTLPSDPVDALRINSSVYYLSQDGSRNYSFDYYVETLSVTAPLLPVLPPTSDSIIMCTELADDRLTHVCNITCYDSIGEVRAPEESTDFEMTFMKYGCNEGPDPTLSEFYGQVKNVVYFNLTYSEICANDTIVLDLDVTVDNVTLLTRDPSTHELVAEVVKLYSNGHHAHTPTPTLPAVPEEEKSHTTIIIIFAVAGGVSAGLLAVLFVLSKREEKAVGTWCVLGEGSPGKELGIVGQLVEEGPSNFSAPINTLNKPEAPQEGLLELAE
ncbi:Adenylate cyclase [Diplonema papillatum]|nr:Adenylate cyclase [Diplonema papillatum]